MFVQPLFDFTRADVSIAGGKGANLGELIRAGFPVPPGFVVTTAAYTDYVNRSGIAAQLREAGAAGDASAARALFSTAPPDDLLAQIRSAYAALGDDVAVAVRSSATAEDLADASFAGQQDSYLNIRGSEAVFDAVRRCWASLWTERAVAYRAKAHVEDAGLALAVVVQQLVPAQAAGVMFTANPTNGQRDEVLIDAAFGLGEAVVGGAVTPDAIIVSGDHITSREIAEKHVYTAVTKSGTADRELPVDRRRTAVLDDAGAIELARLGRAIAAHFGQPQDIEWALSADGFAIVQARPITALPDPIGPMPTDWQVRDQSGMYVRASIVEQLPDPLTPLFADLIGPAVTQSLTSVLTRYFGAGFLGEHAFDFPTINGYAYYYYSRAGMLRMLAATPRAVPAFLRPGAANGLTYWANEAHPAYAELVARESAFEPQALTALDLVDATRRLVDAGALYYTAVQAVIPISAGAEWAFTTVYDLIAKRDGDPAAATFLLGADSAPMRADASLYELARWCRSAPEVADELRSGGDASGLPGAAGEQFRARFAAYLATYGHSTYNLDLASPVAADDPAPVLAALRFYLEDDAPDPVARRQRLSDRRDSAQVALFARLDPLRAAFLRPLLGAAQRTAPAREDALADVGLGWPLARRLVRELGVRLVAAGAITDRDDVFWITATELADDAARLDAGEEVPERSAAVAGRREQWRGRRLAEPPAMLPQNIWMRLFARWMPQVAAGADDAAVLNGLGASGGHAEGPARLLLGPEDFATMRSGDVLVAPITTPAYTPFFAMAAAVVTDVGGPLSHSSIVAREYGIPAVLGTGSATRRITSDMHLVVDGDRGRVILDAGAAGPGDAADRQLPDRDAARRAARIALGVGVVAAGLFAFAARHRRRFAPARGELRRH